MHNIQSINSGPPDKWGLTFGPSRDPIWCFVKAPCWPHRIMQRLVFGFRWKLLEKLRKEQ